MPLLKATTRATTSVIHGCLSRNAAARLPYVEQAHALCEEIAQHLRMTQRLGLLDPESMNLLMQRQQSCSRLLLQWRQTLVLTEEERGVETAGEPWVVAEEPALSARRRRRSRLP